MVALPVSWTIFWLICFLFILPVVYSLFCSGVLDCSPAIHQGAAFHYLVQSAETERLFAVVWLILPPLTLCSPQQRCSPYFSPNALDHWLLGESVKFCMQHSSLMIYLPDPVSQPAGIFSIKIIWKNQKISAWSILIKHPHSSTDSLNPSVNYSPKDFCLSHIHIFYISTQTTRLAESITWVSYSWLLISSDSGSIWLRSVLHPDNSMKRGWLKRDETVCR